MSSPLPLESGAVVTPRKKASIWNLNFFLLWQGQLISALGDTIYAIALGFWVLEKTGSTALMGTLMAVSSLPRILVSPFAGVLVDRLNRKWMLVAMDAVRGVAVVLLAVAAYSGVAQVWMVFAVGIVIGLGAAFFNPAVGSALPDLVPASAIVQANAAFAMLGTGSGMVGSAAGGFLFQLLGAPLMFLLNGVSYVFAAAAALPIRVPRVTHATSEFQFFQDLRAGLAFVWQYRGIRTIVLSAAALNFFANMGIMLLLPLFQQSAALGAGRYGVLMAGLTGGMFAGFLLTSLGHVPFHRRFAVFYVCGVVSMAAAGFVPIWLNMPAMLSLAVLFGLTNAVLNSFLGATLQTAVPQDMRGKVFSLFMMIAGGLTPIAFAAGGALAEVVPVRLLISASFAVTLVCFAPLAASRPLRRLVQFNPEADSLECIR